MSETSPEIEWTDTLEKFFAGTAERCFGLNVLHKASEAHYARLRNFIDIPSLILSVVAGSCSVGSSSLFGDSKYASVSIGCVVLLTTLMNSMNSYFKWAARSEGHRISSLQYAKLSRFLTIQMSLPREERMNAVDLLKYTRENVDRLQEISALIPDIILREYRVKFSKPEYAEVAKPEELNGLQVVKVYNAPIVTLPSSATQ